MNKNLLYSLREVFLFFSKKEIFNNLDLNIHNGNLIALIGKNGVGKSTLMKIIAGLQDVDQGEVWKQPGLKVNYFSQHFELNEKNTIEQELIKKNY